MPGWNFADVWEVVAQQVPDAPALVHGERRVAWADFDRRANGIARTLLDRGAQEQDKVAQYLYNGPEYLESMFGTFKAGLAPINTNYRYLDEELVYLWDNGDVVAVVFHGSFADRIEGIRDRVPRVTTWLWVDDDSGPCPEWAIPYEEAAEAGTPEPVAGPWGRDGDHLLLLYTGGTTGMPKGVMWRQDDLFRAIVSTFVGGVREAPDQDLDIIRGAVTAPGPRGMPACPLMHGTGCFTQLIILSGGGCSVTMESRNLDIEEMLSTIEREGVNTIAIVGDAFAKPMLRALDASPTIAMALTFSRSIVSSRSSTSSPRLSRVTALPPPDMTMSWVMHPVPCMSGQAGSPTAPGPCTRSRMMPMSASPSRTRASNPAPTMLRNRSSCRHITPFGIPVVPPV